MLLNMVSDTSDKHKLGTLYMLYYFSYYSSNSKHNEIYYN